MKNEFYEQYRVVKRGHAFPAGSKKGDDQKMIQKLQERLSHEFSRNLSYMDLEKPVLGFMGTTPDTLGVGVFSQFLPRHSNNIGEHTRHNDEQGFSGTQQLERELISMLGDLFGDPSVDGYVSSGGTEANIEGCWVGREYLRKAFSEHNERSVCLLTSVFRHYSIDKAYRILDLGGGLIAIPTDEEGAMLTDILEKNIHEKYQAGLRKFIIVATAGTTLLGSVDPIFEIGEMIQRLERQYSDIGFYMHVDAAFGGFVAPFLPQPIRIGFNAHPEVASITIDPHKMGLAPYPGGVFMCRNGLIESVTENIGYVGGHKDLTVCGSRSAASVAACWATVSHIGRKGYTERVKRCMEVLEYTRSRMKGDPNITIIPHTLNIFAFVLNNPDTNEALTVLDTFEKNGLKYSELLPENFPDTYKKKAKQYRMLQGKYRLVCTGVPSDFSDPGSPEVRLIRFIFMPHQWLIEEGEKIMNTLVEELKVLL